MNKAVFLDRDGVINRDRQEYTFRVEDFVMLGHLGEVLCGFMEKGYLLIVITNQAGISRGLYGHGDVHKVHDHMVRSLEDEGVRITDIYYCPHYTSLGRCICRKPDSGLLEKALARYDIDPASSYFIGDKPRDMEAAEKAGVKGIRMTTNGDLRTVRDLVK